MAGVEFAREARRDLDADVSVTAPDFGGKFFDAPDLAHDAKAVGVHEMFHQLPALHRAIFVQHDRRDVLHVVVERVAEGDDLHHRRKEHEEQRGVIADDDRELFE